MKYTTEGINEKNYNLFNNSFYRKIDSNHNLNYVNIYNRLYYYSKYRDKKFIPNNIKKLIKNIKYEDDINITNFKCYSVISKEDLINDQDKIILFNMKLPFYLFFRDEIELNKNEKVLKLNN